MLSPDGASVLPDHCCAFQSRSIRDGVKAAPDISRNLGAAAAIPSSLWDIRNQLVIAARYSDQLHRFCRLAPRTFIDSKGRTSFVADAHRGDRKRFVVHADEKLTAFMELEAVTLRW
jgi:hypothetical protein